jgi:hypothetical protein
MKKLLTLILICISIQSFAPRHNIEFSYKKPLDYKEKLILAIALKESGGDSLIVNENEDAVGILQLRKIYVQEANRLSPKKFTYEDRFSKDKSIEIFTVVMNHWCPSYNKDTVAMVHNSGGISDYKFKITEDYRKDVKRIFKTL